MAIACAQATVSAAGPTTTADRARNRLESVDLLRGFAMIFMALDHVRDYLCTEPGMMRLATASAGFFYTRWITHLCAPIFVFLAGTGAALQMSQGRSSRQVARYLLVRGLLLMVLEPTLISFDWTFTFLPFLQVIWTIGISMVILSAFVAALPARRAPVVITAIGAVIVASHNLLDKVHFKGAIASDLWEIVHQTGILQTNSGKPFAFLLYPFLPWTGLMMLGFGFGHALSKTQAPRRWPAVVGLCSLAFFAVLRWSNLYGDPNQWKHYPSAAHTWQSFMDVQKYPPSLLYICVTMGIALLLFTAFEQWHGDSIVRRAMLLFGRTPFFFYVLHIGLIHLIALVLTGLTVHNWTWWVSGPPNGSMFMGLPPGFGYPLWSVYLFWLGVLVVLYFPCRWYARIRPRYAVLRYF